MSRTNHMSKSEIVLPPITVMEDEAKRLNALASSSAVLFPRVAHFRACEMERASIVADNSDLRGVVRMSSQVRYSDDKTGEVRDVVLVYPHEADITLKRVSVLMLVGAALIGLSVGQAIKFQTPDHSKRLKVRPPGWPCRFMTELGHPPPLPKLFFRFHRPDCRILNSGDWPMLSMGERKRKIRNAH